MVTEIGNDLEQARLRRGMTIEETANATQVRGDYLRLMEAGEFEFLAPVYVEGFLRAYAQILGLDPDSLVGELRRQTAGYPQPQPSTGSHSLLMLARIAAGLLALLLLALVIKSL